MFVTNQVTGIGNHYDPNRLVTTISGAQVPVNKTLGGTSLSYTTPETSLWLILPFAIVDLIGLGAILAPPVSHWIQVISTWF